MKPYFLLFLVYIGIIKSQHYGSVIGRVLDRDVQYPMYHCMVQLSGDTIYSSYTDSLGYFLIEKIPVGSYVLKAFADGYKSYGQTFTIEESIVGKTIIYLEEEITQLSPVILHSEQDQPYKVNSNFQFKAKDFARTSASFGDPSRLVQTLPAVVSSSDGTNQISVRGNSPFNNNWYLEGIEIPDPNHFGGYGSSGGFISVFNENTLEQFDFYLGAYPAMYGNSNSSVFDMKLRAGNIKKREQNIRISPLGIYGGAEGYFKKGNRASYLVNARVFDLYFFNKWNIVPKENVTIPSFKDFSYKVNIPSRNDRLIITAFGFGGNNTLNLLYSNRKEQDRNRVICNNLGIHYKLAPKLTVNSTLQHSYVQNNFHKNYPYLDTTETAEKMYRNHTYFQYRRNAKLNLQIGFRLTLRDIHTAQLKNRVLDSLTGKYFYIHKKAQEQGLVSEVYANSIYRCSEKTKLIFGLHTTNVSFNDIVNVEPRLGLVSKLNVKYELSFSVGLYSKIPSYYIYKYSGYRTQSIRSFQFVNSHTFKIDSSCFVKSELFYQYLWNAYLLKDATNASLLNLQNFNFHLYNIVDKPSIAQNYGIDLVFRKTFVNNYSVNLSGALYRSLYLDGQNRWRNTAFDNQFSSSIQAFKEIVVHKSYGLKTITFSFKVLYFGGFYEIPINYKESVNNGTEFRNQDLLFTQKLPNYFRLDLGGQLCYSRKKIKHEIRFDIQNTTNRKNVLKHYYDPQTYAIKELYQLPIIPVVSYTAYF